MSATSSLVTGPVPVWSLLHLVAMASEAMSFGTDSVEFEVTCMIDPVVTDSRSVESVAWFIVTDRISLAGRSLVVVPESMNRKLGLLEQMHAQLNQKLSLLEQMHAQLNQKLGLW